MSEDRIAYANRLAYEERLTLYAGEWLIKHGAKIAVIVGMGWILFEKVPVITLLSAYSVCVAILILKYRLCWLRSLLIAVSVPTAISAVAFGFGPITDWLKGMLVREFGLTVVAAAVTAVVAWAGPQDEEAPTAPGSTQSI